VLPVIRIAVRPGTFVPGRCAPHQPGIKLCPLNFQEIPEKNFERLPRLFCLPLHESILYGKIIKKVPYVFCSDILQRLLLQIAVTLPDPVYIPCDTLIRNSTFHKKAEYESCIYVL
jgi:hypothetical protein